MVFSISIYSTACLNHVPNSIIIVNSQDDVKLVKASDSHIVHMSSPKKLQANRKALMWLKENPPNQESIIIATYYMTVLNEIRNGGLPDDWHMVDWEDVYSSITFM